MFVVVLIIVGIIFDNQHHGNDYWIVQTESNQPSDDWLDRMAIIFTWPLLVLIIISIEHLCLDLIDSWLLCATMFVTLHAIIYMNPVPKLTCFITFLINAVPHPTEIFSTSLLFLNGGNAVTNLLVTGISWSCGFIIWQFQLWNPTLHSTILLVMLVLRVTIIMLVVCVHHGTNLTKGLVLSPQARDISYIFDATEHFTRMAEAIVWSSIVIGAFMAVTPDIYIVQFIDKQLNEIKPPRGLNYPKLPRLILESIILMAPIPTISILACVLAQFHPEDVRDNLFMFTSHAAIYSCISGAIAIFLPQESVARAILILVYNIMYTAGTSSLSVLCDIMVVKDDLYFLSIYIQMRIVALSQIILFIGSFFEYSKWLFNAMALSVLGITIRTILVYATESATGQVLVELSRFAKQEDMDSQSSSEERFDDQENRDESPTTPNCTYEDADSVSPSTSLEELKEEIKRTAPASAS